MFRGFIAATVVRPVTTTMVTIAIVLFGLVAVTRLPVELLPDLSYPTITVRTTYAEAAPAEVEELVTRPVEELVGAVPGVVRIESTSREGESEVALDFAWGTRLDRAMADVREKLDRVRLPPQTDRPIVLRYDPAQEPILRLALTAEPRPGTDGRPTVDLGLLREDADRKVKRQLEKVPGVAAVQIHGGDEDEIVVELDPSRLAALALTSDEVVAAIARDNVNRPGGALSERSSRYLIRTVHESRTPEQLGETIVRSQSGAEVRLRDIAKIRRTAKEREELALLDGREAVELGVYREGDANTVAVAAGVIEALRHLPLESGQAVAVLSNQATFIESAIDEVKNNVLAGGALAILVLLFFLRDLRSTIVIALAIPISLLAAFVPLKMLGVSLNLMSLGGLALGVGMLVDNSIVVLEAIARRREHDPAASRRDTAVAGTTEVASSVVASTLTTIAVFLPMAFVEGVAGQLVRDLSYAVSFSILSSMVVSLTLVPVLQGLGDDTGVAGRTTLAPRSVMAWAVTLPALLWWPIARLVRVAGLVLAFVSRPLLSLWGGLEGLYPPVLRSALRFRSVVLLGAVGVCVLGVGAVGSSSRTLLPQVHQHEFFVQITLPQGAALERTTAVARSLAQAVMGDEDVDRAFARIGSVTQADSATGGLRGTNLAQVNVRIREGADNRDGELERILFERMSSAVGDPDAVLHLERPALFTFDPPIEVQVFGEDPQALREHARRLLPELAAIEGLVEPTPDDLAGRPEVRVRFDRERLGKLGVGVDAAAAAVQRSIQGEVATIMHTSTRQLDVRVQLPRVDRSDVGDVSRIQIAVVDGVAIPLSAVADVEPAIGPAEIRRIDGRRGVRIRARMEGDDLGAVTTAVADILGGHGDTSHGITAEVAGQADEMKQSLTSLVFTALLSAFMVYVVMAASFESLLHPFLIMFTVPLAAAGALLLCAVTGTPISAMVGIGVIILAGIIVNNAIVLVNAVNQRRGAGMNVDQALSTAAAMRLRPILMTTLTTILGLLPMALGLGDGAALRQPLALSVIGGLTVGTLLTLIVIPCAYSVLPGKHRDAWG